MKKLLAFFLASSLPLMLNGCEFIGDVFKTGIWVGIIIIVAIIAVIAGLVKIFSK
ncbi:MAG: hypothetical protein SGI89_14470 [bacterium]|nr:hypothetical protein [bacterium]